ncbi:thioredoxin family protein [Flavobacterium sp.]|uniref:thioredoxin family protein n=1 Tax=Flavobacterium sp. TaxID=239 RepID=UPI003D6B093C
MSVKLSTIINSKRLVLIDFHKPTCDSSQSLLPVLERVQNCLQKRVVIVKVNVNKNKQLAENYCVTNFPTLMLFRNGKQLWIHSGYLNRGSIILKIIERNHWNY